MKTYIQPNIRHLDEVNSLCLSMQADEADVFIASLQTYLRANELGTGTSHKLWEAVAQQTGLPITRWMEQWTFQGGFPLVSATMQGSQVMVSQVGSHATGMSSNCVVVVACRKEQKKRTRLCVFF